MCPLVTAVLLLAFAADLACKTVESSWCMKNGHTAGWFNNPPSPLYPSSGKRHHLPYHPVARFRGADTRPYFPYEMNVFPEYVPPPVISQGNRDGSVPDGPMNAGELLALLFSGIRQGEPSSKMRGTLRFGIARR